MVVIDGIRYRPEDAARLKAWKQPQEDAPKASEEKPAPRGKARRTSRNKAVVAAENKSEEAGGDA